MVKILEIIKINKKHGGVLVNKSSLDYAVDRANRERNIYKSNAYLLRGIIIDHPFLDGNKRTATEIILNRFRKANIKCNETKFASGIINIAKNNIHNINKIEKRLRKWCPKK